MTNKNQIDLAYIAGLSDEGNKIMGSNIRDEQTRSALRRYNELVGEVIHHLAYIVSQQDHKIRALEYRLGIDNDD